MKQDHDFQKKQIKCLVCNKIIPYDKYENHVKTSHSGIKWVYKYNCQFCNAFLLSDNNLG